MFRTCALTVVLTCALLGCSGPSLDNDDDDSTPVDDDDTVFGDDDDIVNDDDDIVDDDDDIDDDDDDDDVWPTESCEELGEGSVGGDVFGAPADGEWIEGELGWDGENLTVAPEFGPAMAIRVWSSAPADLDTLMDGIEGQGMLFQAVTGSGGWDVFGVVAAVTDAGDVVALGYGGGPPEAFDGIGFTLRVEPDFGRCGEGMVETDCGLASALPLSVSWMGGDTGMEGEIWPGMSMQLGDDLQFTQYSGYTLSEAWCDDYPDDAFSWSLHR